MSKEPDYSYEFYRHHATEYADWWTANKWDVSNSTHPRLTDMVDLSNRVMELVPPSARGLDAGCGPGIREFLHYWSAGYDIVGIDAVEENLRVARKRHPDLERRLLQADLSRPLDFPDAHFHFIICTTVIQHIAPDKVMNVTLPEFARVLEVGGILQMMFKNGKGIATVYDKIYGLDRSFQLYDPGELLGRLKELGMELVPDEGDRLGGIIYYVDSKGADTCIFFARKVE
ncbi:MAG: class I SAM-dependent methyltransferase [Dehalococcoidia bacterium]